MRGGLLRRLAGSALDKEVALDHFLLYGQLWRVYAQQIDAPEHFLQCSGNHPHPDPICSANPSPRNATSSRSMAKPPAVHEHSTLDPAAHNSVQLLVNPVKGDFF